MPSTPPDTSPSAWSRATAPGALPTSSSVRPVSSSDTMSLSGSPEVDCIVVVRVSAVPASVIVISSFPTCVRAVRSSSGAMPSGSTKSTEPVSISKALPPRKICPPSPIVARPVSAGRAMVPRTRVSAASVPAP